jgi:hypothetical protein
MSTAAGAVLIKERHIVEAFERAGATGPERAQSLDDIPVGSGGLALSRLRQRGIIREITPGRFYADLDTWRGLHRARRRMAVAALIVALLFACAVEVAAHH